MLTLTRGSRGADVRRVQDMLARLGYPVGAIDGDFGPLTEAAVRAFQAAQVSGQVDDPTWQRLFAAVTAAPTAPPPVAWGAKVSPAFRDRVRQFPTLLNAPATTADDYMAVMAFETGRTFDPAIRNAAGSGAVGLIQFMPATLGGDFGLTVGQAAAMTAEEQLELVLRYWSRYAGRLVSLSDVYMAVLLPSAIGKAEDQALFTAGTKAYLQNRGLDANTDGRITKAEAAARVLAMRAEGLMPGNAA